MLTFILLLALLCGKVDGTGTPAPAFVEGIGEGPHSTPYSPAPTPEGTNGHPTFNPSTPAPTPGGSNGHPTFNPSTPAPTPEGSNSHPTFNPSTLPPIGSGGSPCFDPDSSASVNIDTYLGGVRLMFHGCEISDDDLEDVAALFDEVGRASITSVWLTSGTVTTLPEGYFDGFENLLWLSVENHALSSLPAGIFDELHGLRTLILINNDLTTLPPDLFGRGLSGLERLELQENELVTIEAGTFDALTSLYSLNLIETSLVSLPFGLFAELDNLEFLQIALNFDLKCIPYTDAAMNWFESTSDTCDCTQAEEDACSEGFVCNPAATDHDCGATPAPTPGPTFEGTNGGPTIAPDTPAPTFQGTDVGPTFNPYTLPPMGPAQTCSNGMEGFDANGVVCCPVSCGGCAGEGCSHMPGGPSECCGGRIKSSGVYCEDFGAAPPCIIGSAPPAETCSNGIEGIDANGVVCCPLSCGGCAGEGCSSMPGGPSKCCGGGIKASGVLCSESGAAPCVIKVT